MAPVSIQFGLTFFNGFACIDVGLLLMHEKTSVPQLTPGKRAIFTKLIDHSPPETTFEQSLEHIAVVARSYISLQLSP